MVWKNICSSFILQDIHFSFVQRTSFNIFHRFKFAGSEFSQLLFIWKNKYFAFILKRYNWKMISTLEMPLHCLSYIATAEKLLCFFFFTKCVFLFFFGYFQDSLFIPGFSVIAVVFCNFVLALVLLGFLDPWVYHFHQIWKNLNRFFQIFFCPLPSVWLQLHIHYTLWSFPTIHWSVFFLTFFSQRVSFGIVSITMSSSSLIFSSAESNLLLILSNYFFHFIYCVFQI